LVALVVTKDFKIMYRLNSLDCICRKCHFRSQLRTEFYVARFHISTVNSNQEYMQLITCHTDC